MTIRRRPPSRPPVTRPALVAVLAVLLGGWAVPALAQEPTEPHPPPSIGVEAADDPMPRRSGEEEPEGTSDPSGGDAAPAEGEAASESGGGEAAPTEHAGPSPSAPSASGSGGASFDLPAAPDAGDERSAVLLERVCETRADREEVTLFANGTVRLRHELTDAAAIRSHAAPPEMALGELPPDELEAWVDAIRDEDLGEEVRHSAGPVGEMVERCRLILDYDAMARWVGPPPPPRGDRSDWRPAGRRVVEYGGFDSLGLTFARVLERVDAIAARVDLAAGRRTLPPRYEPAQGDVLRRADGILFRVERSTASPGGWELQGVDQPLTLYLLEDDFPRVFHELVRRR